MSNIFKIFLNVNITFIIFCVISLTNSELQNIDLNNGTYTSKYNIKSEKEYPQFKVTGAKDYDYLRIKVSSEDEKNINNIISYFQLDDKFLERKQLSQSLTNTTIMWLTKDQIKTDFYFSVECPKYPCSYNLDINNSSSAELIINEQYTYYITEENKNMNFIIQPKEYMKSFDNASDYMVTIWIRGNKEISSNINIEEKENPHKNYYRIYLSDLLNSECKLQIDAKTGDFINVGILLFKIEESNFDEYLITESILEYNGIEIVGVLKPLEKTIFKLNEYAYNLEFPYNLDTNELLIAHSNENKIDGYYTVELRNYDYENPIFYSFKFIKENKYDEQGNNQNYPQLFNFPKTKEIKEGEIISIIPMKPDEDFNFINYEIINSNLEQQIKASIYHCDNYPLCHIDNNAIEKSEKNINYKWYNYYSFNKTEWGNINPISKNQNILLIKCEKGINFDGKTSCSIRKNVLTDKNELDMINYSENNVPLYKYIRKDEKNKFFYKGTEQEIYLNIETISGDIDIEINTKDYYYNENKKLYIIPENKDIDITITGKNNSIYLIQDIYPLIFSEEIINSGANYFINLENSITIQPVEFFDQKSSKEKKYFIGIYPLECIMTVESYKFEGDEKKTLTQKNGFYQEISSDLEIKYLFTNKNENNKNCQFYISFYELDEKNGIYLSNNVQQPFLLNSNYKKLTFNYIYIKQDYDLEANIKLNLTKDEGNNYKIQLYLNDNKYKEPIKVLDGNNEIKLSYNEIKENCKDFIYFCKINLIVELQKKEDEGGDDEDDDDDDSNTLAIIFICVGGAFFIIIIIVVIFLVKTYGKKRNLEKDINKTSFEVDNEKENKELLISETG